MSEQMNIYCVSFDYDGFGLSAVVVSDSESAAVDVLELDEEYKVKKVLKIGTAFTGIARVICRESL